MRRSQVEHVLRAAAAIAQEQSFVVVGSQAGLLRHRMIAPDTLLQRLALLDAAKYPVQQLIEWARRRVTEADL